MLKVLNFMQACWLSGRRSNSLSVKVYCEAAVVSTKSSTNHVAQVVELARI